jgi:hypothetical protein
MAYIRVTGVCWKFLLFMLRSSWFQKFYVLICVCKTHSDVYHKGNAQYLKNKYYIHTLRLCSKGIYMQETVVCFDGGSCLSAEQEEQAD